MKLCIHLLRAAVVLAVSTFGAADRAVASDAPRDAYIERVQPFLTQFCGDCHGADAQEGGLALHVLDFAAVGAQDAETWAMVSEKLVFSEMPPPEAEQPDRRARSSIAGWINEQLRLAGHEPDWQLKLLHPDYGNLIGHESLFDGSVDAVAYTSSRLRRRSPQIFDVRNVEVTVATHQERAPACVENRASADFAAG